MNQNLTPAQRFELVRIMADPVATDRDTYRHALALLDAALKLDTSVYSVRFTFDDAMRDAMNRDAETAAKAAAMQAHAGQPADERPSVKIVTTTEPLIMDGLTIRPPAPKPDRAPLQQPGVAMGSRPALWFNGTADGCGPYRWNGWSAR